MKQSNAARAAAVMAAAGGGSIINISSVAAMRPTSHEVPYGAAKAGLHVVTAGIALEYGPSVRANTIMAGPFLTDISAAWTDEMRREFEQRLALRRCGRPEEVVGAALFLASDASSFATGAILRLDGGVPNDSGCPSALGLDGFHHAVELIVLPRQVVNHDVDSLVCKSKGNGFADALRRPGDDGNARSSAGKILVNHSGKGSCC